MSKMRCRNERSGDNPTKGGRSGVDSVRVFRVRLLEERADSRSGSLELMARGDEALREVRPDWRRRPVALDPYLLPPVCSWEVQ